MSLQSNLHNVREEFKRDEKLLENAFRLELLIHRYRRVLIALGVCIVGALLWWGISGYIESSRAKAANAAYAALLANPNDTSALATLKEKSPALHDLYLYNHANGDTHTYEALKNSTNGFVKMLANYELASAQASEILKNNSDKEARTRALEAFDKLQNGGLRDFALLQSAYLLFAVNDVAQAHQKLLLISQDSPFSAQASLLKHYGIESKPLDSKNAQTQGASTDKAGQSAQ